MLGSQYLFSPAPGHRLLLKKAWLPALFKFLLPAPAPNFSTKARLPDSRLLIQIPLNTFNGSGFSSVKFFRITNTDSINININLPFYDYPVTIILSYFNFIHLSFYHSSLILSFYIFIYNLIFMLIAILYISIIPSNYL